MKDLLRGSEVATVACCSQLSNISHESLQQYFAKLPFEKSISVYSQNLWISLWINPVDGTLKWRGVWILLTPLIFCMAIMSLKNNVLT
jgi:hypothetical protein